MHTLMCLLSCPLVTLFHRNVMVVICKYLPNDLHACHCWLLSCTVRCWRSMLWVSVSQFALTIYTIHIHTTYTCICIYIQNCSNVELCHKQNIAIAAAAESYQCCLFAISVMHYNSDFGLYMSYSPRLPRSALTTWIIHVLHWRIAWIVFYPKWIFIIW